jgi:hypothetical protein
VSLVTLGAVVDMIDTAYSKFAYPTHRSELKLIGNGTDAGNVVIQDSALPVRQATLSLLVETTGDVELIRGYEETGELVEFIDNAGLSRSVMVFSFTGNQRQGEDSWDVALTLLEYSEPTPPGS